MHIVLFLLFGLIVGATARFLVPGGGRGGWLVSIALGILGSGLGAFLGRVFGLYGEGEPAGFFVSVGGAILILVAYHAVVRRRALA